MSSKQESGKFFAAALKTAVSALLVVTAATLANCATAQAQSNQVEWAAEQYQLDDTLQPTLKPKFTCQIDEDPIEQLNAWSTDHSHVQSLEVPEPYASEPRTNQLLQDSSNAFETIINEQAFDKLLSLFNPQIEAEIRWWCSHNGQSVDFGVAAHLFNPGDWKETAIEWNKQIQGSARHIGQAQALRQDLIHQIMSSAFEKAKTLTRAQIEATGIENPVLASAVLDLQTDSTRPYDEALGSRNANLKTAAQGTSPLSGAFRMTVRDNAGPPIAAGIAGVAIGAVIANALNKPKAPPAVIYQNAPPPAPSLAPQTYYYNQSTGSVIGPGQGALQRLASVTGSYVPLTTYTPRSY